MFFLYSICVLDCVAAALLCISDDLNYFRVPMAVCFMNSDEHFRQDRVTCMFPDSCVMAKVYSSAQLCIEEIRQCIFATLAATHTVWQSKCCLAPTWPCAFASRSRDHSSFCIGFKLSNTPCVLDKTCGLVKRS